MPASEPPNAVPLVALPPQEPQEAPLRAGERRAAGRLAADGASEVVRRLQGVLRRPANRAGGVVVQRPVLTRGVRGTDRAAPVDVERVVASDEALLDLVERQRGARGVPGGAVHLDRAAAGDGI